MDILSTSERACGLMRDEEARQGYIFRINKDRERDRNEVLGVRKIAQQGRRFGDYSCGKGRCGYDRVYQKSFLPYLDLSDDDNT